MTAARMTSKAQRLFNDAVNLINRGDLEQAERLVADGRTQDPDNADGKHLQGILAAHRRDFAAAEKWVGEAVKVMPQFAGFHLSLGRIYAQQGKHDQSVHALAQAIKYNPKDVSTRKLFAHQLRLMGDLSSAHRVYDGLIEDDHKDQEIVTGMALCVQFAQATSYDPALDKKLLAYLKLPKVDYNYLSGYVGTHLIHKYRMDDPESSLELDEMAQDPLLIEGLTKMYFNSPVVEIVMTQVRRFVLMQSLELGAVPDAWLDMVSALAIQCFNNEYVYYRDAEEAQMLELLLATVEESTAQGEVNFDEIGHAILLIALYKTIDAMNNEAFKSVTSERVPTYLKMVFELGYRQMVAEKQKAKTIKSLTAIDDETSKTVQAMYEKSPYPRWLHLHTQNRTTYLEYIRQYLPHYQGPEFLHTGEPLKVLIAGCGTGNHALTVAKTFKNIEVTAIDISRRSLAYGENKAEEHGVDNVTFYHADILKLGELNEKFHIIESAGVLHHMLEPEKGWAVLRKLLVPHGIMLIGLYSKYARRHIIDLRQAVDNMGLKATDDDIRAFRHAVVSGQVKGDINHIMSVNDFYSLSGCRDLLFHEQEHQFTCDRIAKACKDLELEFSGFTGDSGRVDTALREYAQQFPNDPFRNHLPHWDEYEKQHPDTFIGMYQFWCEAKT